LLTEHDEVHSSARACLAFAIDSVRLGREKNIGETVQSSKVFSAGKSAIIRAKYLIVAHDHYRLSSGDPRANGERGSGGAIISACFGEDAGKVVGDGLLAQHQFLSDLAITLASHHEAQDFGLPRA